ncbi:receptor activity-modifying protein 2 [Melanotaenia boesemani]|uniref:receptor activity-modifying protein 2 n=1 Tax=Melanotaenia boesemani TaxID=1250792 RepID=UPI001C03BA71|nr:receptor activity-modifying protein 2 [Melanotaenia boesemani]
MNRTLLGKMIVTRFPLVFLGCSVILLNWGSTTVVCLVNNKVTVQPVTVAGSLPTEKMTTDVTGNTSLPFACANNSHCMAYCNICAEVFGGPTMDCLLGMLSYFCLNRFENAMSSMNSTDWCIWGNVNSLYSNLSFCTEEISDCLVIPWPNWLVEQTFVDIHYKFFKECPTEEFSDPPPAIVFALVITPICLIPVMVGLVVLKTKNGDGSS